MKFPVKYNAETQKNEIDWVEYRNSYLKEMHGKFTPRDPTRIDVILAKIKEVWMKDTDLRLGQLILNCRDTDLGDNAYRSMYNMEEEELLAQLTKVYKL